MRVQYYTDQWFYPPVSPCVPPHLSFFVHRSLEISYQVPCGNSPLNFTISSDKDLLNAVVATMNLPYLELTAHITDESKLLLKNNIKTAQ